MTLMFLNIFCAAIIFLGVSGLPLLLAEATLWLIYAGIFTILLFLLATMWASDWGDDPSDDAQKLKKHLEGFRKNLKEGKRATWVAIVDAIISITPVALLITSGYIWLPIVMVITIITGTYCRSKLIEHF